MIVWVYLHSIFLWWALKDASFLEHNAYRPFKVVDSGTNRKGICDFLLVINSNFGPIIAPFLRYSELLTENCDFPTPLSFNTLARGEPFRISGSIFYPENLRVLKLSVGEDLVILACVVFTQCQPVTDRQTDGMPIMASTGLA